MWSGLKDVEQAKHHSGQTNAAHAAPTPFAEAMIERVGYCTDQPSQADPARPLRHGCQHEATEKQFLDRTIDEQVVKSLQQVVADSRPAKPGTNDNHAISRGKASH